MTTALTLVTPAGAVHVYVPGRRKSCGRLKGAPATGVLVVTTAAKTDVITGTGVGWAVVTRDACS